MKRRYMGLKAYDIEIEVRTKDTDGERYISCVQDIAHVVLTSRIAY